MFLQRQNLILIAF